MSSNTWTPCVAISDKLPFRRLALQPHRVVESQHKIATRKLVDTDAEQALLEAMIDRVKPPVPPRMSSLHYLLSTPFRHPPLRWGSRFGTRQERGIWYGAVTLTTAFAEVAYYRYVFLAGSTAKLTPLSVELSAFRAAVATRKGIDLSRPPYVAQASQIFSKTTYLHSQPLGAQLRAAGTEAFLFTSARDVDGGMNVGLFEPCFAKKSPYDLKTYFCTTSDDAVEIARKDVTVRDPDRYAFPRKQFLVNGAIPIPVS
jgi:hypothetical protein